MLHEPAAIAAVIGACLVVAVIASREVYHSAILRERDLLRKAWQAASIVLADRQRERETGWALAKLAPSTDPRDPIADGLRDWANTARRREAGGLD